VVSAKLIISYQPRYGFHAFTGFCLVRRGRGSKRHDGFASDPVVFPALLFGPSLSGPEFSARRRLVMSLSAAAAVRCDI